MHRKLTQSANTYVCICSKIYNILPLYTKRSNSFEIFKKKITTRLQQEQNVYVYHLLFACYYKKLLIIFILFLYFKNKRIFTTICDLISIQPVNLINFFFNNLCYIII